MKKFIAVAVTIWAAYFAHLLMEIWHRKQQSKPAPIKFEETLKTPELSALAVHYFLDKMYTKIDDFDVRFAETGEDGKDVMAKAPFKSQIKSFQTNGSIDSLLGEITNTLPITRSNHFRLVYLPDYHANTSKLPFVQNEKTIARQKKIVEIINREKPTLVLAEGVLRGETPRDEQLKWQEANKNYAHLVGTNAFEALRWCDLITDTTIVIRGCDDGRINMVTQFVLTLREMKQYHGEGPDEELKSDIKAVILSGFRLREHIALAEMVETLQARKLSEAYLVMGESHEDGLRVACKYWNIEFEVKRE